MADELPVSLQLAIDKLTKEAEMMGAMREVVTATRVEMEQMRRDFSALSNSVQREFAMINDLQWKTATVALAVSLCTSIMCAAASFWFITDHIARIIIK